MAQQYARLSATMSRMLMSVSLSIYVVPNCKTVGMLCSLIEREEFSDHDKNCQRNTSYLPDSLIKTILHLAHLSRQQMKTIF